MDVSLHKTTYWMNQSLYVTYIIYSMPYIVRDHALYNIQNTPYFVYYIGINMERLEKPYCKYFDMRRQVMYMRATAGGKTNYMGHLKMNVIFL